MIIDTHVHLNDPNYKNDLDLIINEAFSNEIRKMIVIGYDRASSIEAIRISEKYEGIYAAIGLHPSEVLKETDKDLNWLKKLLNNKKVVAIGEIGIDLYWDKTFLEDQLIFFNKQIEIAKENNLPIIIHSRDAINETYKCIAGNKVRGVVHCYGSSTEMAKLFIKERFYIGIGGVVTFKNSKLKEVVKNIDLQYLLTETDAPYLSPVPFRGQLNKPLYIKYVLTEIANIKEVDEIIVEKAIEKNVYDLFRI